MRLLSLVSALVFGSGALSAQPVIAPTPDRPSDLLTLENYSVTNSFEVGYRFSDVGGNRDVYRSSVNYGNGMRLLEGELRLNSKDGHGSLFDEFAFHTSGIGNDPYQSSNLKIEKNGLYRYGMRFRIINYFNQLPSLWSGEHGLNSERILQSHDLTLLPGRRFQVFLGYDRNNHNGPGFSSDASSNLADLSTDNFLRYETNLRQVNNQYRVGTNFTVAGVAFTFMQSLDNYKEDTEFSDASQLASLAPNVQAVDAISRAEPFHGNTPVTSINVRSQNEGLLGFYGRYVYSSGSRNSKFSQTLMSSSAFQSVTRQTFVLGDADRSQGTGDFTLLLTPSSKFTLTNTTSINNARIDGSSSFLETTLFTNERVTFEHLGTRHISNSTEVNYRPIRRVGFYGSYKHLRRRIRSESAFDFPGGSFGIPLEGQDNEVNSGGGGVRLTPIAGMRISFDAEVGRADRPLTPISDRNFHNESARVQWRKNGLLLSSYFKSKINANPVSLIDYSSTSRSWGFSGAWSDSDARLTLDAGYSKIDLDTSAGIFNFFDPARDALPGRSVYTSNLHTLNFGVRVAAHEKLTLYLGYALTKDTADGSRSAQSPDSFIAAYPNVQFEPGETPTFRNTFPLTYHTPQGRVSVRLRDGLEWNAGWQYYSYSERFTGLQNYRAHVGYTSLRLSFR